MEVVSHSGRTAVILRVSPGRVRKMPREIQEGMPDREKHAADVRNAFITEETILRRLGSHSRIVPFYGSFETGGPIKGLLLGEANQGDLQDYLKFHTPKAGLRMKWVWQIATAIAYIHEQGVIHSDLCTANILVHQTREVVDLLLTDFGGSRCESLGVYGDQIPDDPFSDPLLTDYQSFKVDVFSLGVVIYVIVTGYYPFISGPIPENEERFVYGEKARKQFELGRFPELSQVSFADIISGCCCERRFETGLEVIEAMNTRGQESQDRF